MFYDITRQLILFFLYEIKRNGTYSSDVQSTLGQFRVERVELEGVGGEFEELVLGTPEVGVADGLPGRRQVVLHEAQVLVTPANIKHTSNL
jgi:hypothetical protein